MRVSPREVCLDGRRRDSYGSGVVVRTAPALSAAFLIALLAAPNAYAGGGQAPAGDIPADAEFINDLPVSLDRIRELLNQLPALEDRDGVLRLNIQVRVFAPAPEIRLYQGIDLEHSPPRYGSPAHAEMAALTTPSRHRFRNGTPAINSGHLISWGGR